MKLREKLNKYSKTLTQDSTQPAAQAMYYAIGFKEEDFNKEGDEEIEAENVDLEKVEEEEKEEND